MIKMELRKLYKSWPIIFLIVVLLLCNLSLFYINITNDDVYKGDYRSYYYLSLKQDDPLKYIQNEKDILSFYSAYDPITNEIFNIEIYEDKYGDDWVKQRMDELSNNEYIYESITSKMSALNALSNEWSSALEYNSWRDALISNAQKPSISIFEETSPKEKEILADAYSNLKLDINTMEGSYSIKQVLDFIPNDIFTLLVIIIIISRLFIKEKEEGKLLYYKSTVNGNFLLFINKTIITVVLSFIYYLIVNIAELNIGFELFGKVNILSPVQSLSFLSTTPYSLSILSFLILYYLIVLVAYIFLVSILIYLAYSNFSTAVSALFVLALYEGSILLFNHFNSVSLLPILGEVNIYNYLHPYDLLSSLEFYNLNNILIPKIIFLLLVLAVSAAILFASYKKDLNSNKRHLFKQHYIKAKPRPLFVLELKKILVKDFGIFVIALVLIVGANYIANLDGVTNINDIRYNNYINIIGDRVSFENTEKLENIREEFISLNEELAECDDLANRMVISRKLENEAAFMDYENSYMLRESIDSSRIIPKEDHYRLLYLDNDFTKLVFVLISISILYMTIASTHRERRYRMKIIQATSTFYEKSLGFKVSIIALINCLLYIILNILFLFKVMNLYPDINLNIPLNSLNIFFNTDFSIPFYIYYLLISATGICFIILLCETVFFISDRYDKHIVVIIIFILIAIIPVLLENILNIPSLMFIYYLYHPFILVLDYNWLLYLLPAALLSVILFTILKKRVINYPKTNKL